MKYYFLNLRTASQLKKNKVQRVSKPYDEARKVGILFTVEDKQKHDLIKEFLHKLEKDGKQVTVLCFLPKNKDNYEFMFDFFTLEDVSFWGKINQAAVDKFCQQPFDYIYYIDTHQNPILLNVLARSKALCRMGKNWNDGHPYFELMIDSQPTTRNLMDGLYQYSARLK
jgi:hypothetical protein